MFFGCDCCVLPQRVEIPFKGDLPGVHVSDCDPVTSKTRRPKQDMGCNIITKKSTSIKNSSYLTRSSSSPN